MEYTYSKKGYAIEQESHFAGDEINYRIRLLLDNGAALIVRISREDFLSLQNHGIPAYKKETTPEETKFTKL